MSKTHGEDREKRALLAAVIVLAAFTVVFFRSVILHPGGMIYSPLSDLVGQTFGWKVMIRNTLWGHGALPLWNPHLMCGYPVLGNLNYALLFPMHLLYLLLPAGPAASWTYLLTHFLGALAAWYYLRVIGVRNWGAVIGGLAYGFGVRNLGHLTNGFVGHLETLPFLPLAFAFAAKLARQRNWRHVAVLALVLAVVLLSAFAQIFLFLMLILPCYFAWLVLAGEGDRRWVLSGFQFLLAVALACGLAAVHLLPAVQLLPELSRSSELSPELYRLGSLPLRHFFTLLNPELLGRIAPQWCYFGSAYFWTLAFYTPILLLPLAFLSFCSAEGRRHRNFFLILIPAIFLFAMGPFGPLYDFCHRFIPGVKLFREPARILFFFPLAMAVLAGLGWNGLRGIGGSSRRGMGRKLVAASMLLPLLLGAGYWFYWSGAGEAVERSHRVSAAFFTGNSPATASLVAEYGRNLKQLLPRTLLASLVLFGAAPALLITALRRGPGLSPDTLKGLALLVLAADLLYFGRGYLNTADSQKLFLEQNLLVRRLTELQAAEPPFRVADLSGVLTDNLACIAGIHKVGGYDPINLLSTQRYFDAVNGRESQQSTAWTLRVEPEFQRRLLDLLNARYLLTRQPMDVMEDLELVASFEPLPVTLQNFGQVAIPGVRLYRNLRAAPRAWFVSGSAAIQPGRSLARQLELIDPDREVLLEAGSSYPHRPAGPGKGYREAKLFFAGPNRIEVQGEFPGTGLLVVSQAWSAGWSAEDRESGRALPVLRANGMLTAVPVEGAGRRRIQLSYDPPGLRWGLALSTLSLLGLVALVLVGRRFRRPPAKTAKGGTVQQEPDDNEHDLVGKGNRIDPQEIEHQQQIDGNGQGIEDP